MTDGLVKHEGVVSINGVPAHPSTNAAEGNMCMFFFVIFFSFPFFFLLGLVYHACAWPPVTCGAAIEHGHVAAPAF